MSPHNRLAWPFVALLTILLMSVLVFLYAKTQRGGESDYFENVALLRHLKQLDAEWESDVLRSKIGLNVHYDPLADSLKELGGLLDKFEADVQLQSHHDNASLTQSSVALREIFRTKSAMIERFKSNNAVLRNSLTFLPTAASDVQQSVRVGRTVPTDASNRTLETVNKLLLQCMLFSQTASDDRRAEIEAGLLELDAHKKNSAREMWESVDIFHTHVRTVLREQKAVNDLLGRIALVSTAARIDEVHNLLGAEQQYASEQGLKYRRYLLMFSALLIALLLYAAVHLVRSLAVISRFNRELQLANDNLEQRVQERTRELRQTQSELVTTARQAGMAEIAANVLHTVGNVLNSVNVSADVVVSRLRSSKVTGLTKAVEMMNEHKDDLGEFLTADAKGRLLPGYLAQLSETLVIEKKDFAEEMGSLSKSVDHIKEIIAAQQSYAGSSRIIEQVQVQSLVEDALRMNADELTLKQVIVEKTFADVPELPLDKGRILQILVNLISNAKQAMDGITGREPKLAIQVSLTPDQVLTIRVADNGVGIAAENLTRVFSHGFTTKLGGHGFGLHSAVNAAREMDGALTVESNGPGTGAAFTLAIPLSTTKGVP